MGGSCCSSTITCGPNSRQVQQTIFEMAATTAENQGIRPIFTVEAFNQVEAELERDGEDINLMANNGTLLALENPCRGPGRTDPPPFETDLRNSIKFGREKGMQLLKAAGSGHLYPCAFVQGARRHGPQVSEGFAEAKLAKVMMDWEFSEQCMLLVDTLRSMEIPKVDKIIAFGPGSIAFDATDHEREHAMFLTVARVLSQKYGKDIPVYVQEPAYTSVCKEVLPKFGFKIIDCFGARGLTMIDDNTVLLVHRPDFAIRQIVADLGVRPAAMFWRPVVSQVEWDELSEEGDEVWHDEDTAKTRVMMGQYTRVDIPGSKVSQCSFVELHDAFNQSGGQDVFFSSTWYVRRQ
ncbi:hypothetical protein F4776DRAFT_616514 [Hypoxylon sp. NC0597]|nr:hypothetical protein F4776DRAFT_616514 [Hypoxylon sp. NC0597]